MVFNIHTNRKAYYGRGEERERVLGAGVGNEIITCRYTATSRMTPALRWAAMRAHLTNVSRFGLVVRR